MATIEQQPRNTTASSADGGPSPDDGHRAGSNAIPQLRPGMRPAVWVLLILGVLVMIVPFVWMLLASVKTQVELLQTPPTWFPDEPTLDNYRELFDRLDFPRYFWNSTIIAGLITGSNLLFCSMVGYALAKIEFRGRDKLFVLIIATMMVPSSVTLVPLFVLMSRLELVNSYAGAILPTAAGAFGVFLMRQFIMGLPSELLEAARVDGAGHLGIFTRIVLPLSTAPLAVLAIFTFLGAWNAFLWPLIILQDDAMYTLPVALGTFAIGEHRTDYGLLMAGSVVIIAPIVVVFLALQRYFTESIVMTGVK